MRILIKNILFLDNFGFILVNKLFFIFDLLELEKNFELN